MACSLLLCGSVIGHHLFATILPCGKLQDIACENRSTSCKESGIIGLLLTLLMCRIKGQGAVNGLYGKGLRQIGQEVRGYTGSVIPAHGLQDVLQQILLLIELVVLAGNFCLLFNKSVTVDIPREVF